MMYSLYNKDTGIFTGYKLNCPEPFLADNVPEGQSCLLGDYDHLRQCVNIATGEVVDYQPPAPGDSFTWDADTKSWVYVATDADLALAARKKRNELLATYDWVTLRAYRTGEPVPQAWALYQEALADVPAQPGFPRDIIWPTPPTE